MLEAEPSLKFNHTPGQGAGRSTEIRVLNIGTRTIETEGLQVQDVEDVEEVGPDIKPSPFTKKTTQTETLGDR